MLRVGGVEVLGVAEEQYDLALVQGEDFLRRFAYRHADGTYLDFRTCLGFDAQVRAKEDAKSRLLIDLRAGDPPMLVVDPANAEGKYLRLLIPGHVTAPLSPKLFPIPQLGRSGGAAWDLFATMPDGMRVRILQGGVTLDPAATALP